jgi:hypothetical protein
VCGECTGRCREKDFHVVSWWVSCCGQPKPGKQNLEISTRREKRTTEKPNKTLECMCTLCVCLVRVPICTCTTVGCTYTYDGHVYYCSMYSIVTKVHVITCTCSGQRKNREYRDFLLLYKTVVGQKIQKLLHTCTNCCTGYTYIHNVHTTCT